jgi:hypothetical protein
MRRFDTRHSTRAGLITVGLLLLLGWFMIPGKALAFDLSGAWASERDLCGQVFSKKGDTVEFAELSDLYGSGFIVNGNRIRGKAAQCTITSQKQDGDNLELSAACASSIMNQNVKFNLKIIDDNNINRSFPEISGMTLKYSRCPS